MLIAAEREKRPVSQLLASLEAEHSEITVMELEHGCQRANTPEAAAKRRRYLDEVLASTIDGHVRQASLTSTFPSARPR